MNHRWEFWAAGAFGGGALAELIGVHGAFAAGHIPKDYDHPKNYSFVGAAPEAQNRRKP